MKQLLCFFILIAGKISCQDFYDLNTIQKIEITFTQANWDYQLDTAKLGADGYIQCNQVKINGTIFNNVGVKYKGNSSFSPTSNKNPIHIELDAFQEQSYQGYKDLKLGNNYQDPSFIREALSYDILRNYMHCSKSNFAKVYINGAYNGVYTNTEAVNKKFYDEHFYGSDNITFKANPIVNPGTATKCNLKYINADSSSYKNFYELKSLGGWNDLVSLCDTVTNFPTALERNLDMDKVIWMLAFNAAFVNLDSYTGAFCQNYYIYKDEHKRYNPIVWDLNMSFGGFPFVGSGTVSLGSQNIAGLQQLSLNTHSSDVHWPLINKVLADPTYKKMYSAHVKTIINEMIATNTYSTKAETFRALIDTSVLSDQVKTYSYAQFQNAMTGNVSVGSYSVPGIATLMGVRNTYLQAQPEFTLVAPTVTNISYSPSTPTINSQVYITASITNVSSVYLKYRHLNSDLFSKVLMLDDGLNGDGAAGDNVYGASFVLAGNNTQYYIYAENSNAGIFSPARAEHEFHQINIYPIPQVGQIVINEFLASNESDVRNEFNLHEDWIELYNPTNSALSLANFYLTNENSNRRKYAFPHNTYIPANGFLIVWADKITLPGNQLHASFKLDEDGDNIILSNGLTVLDSYDFSNQSKDVSTGRCPDGHGAFSAHEYPSYGLLNCIVNVEENQLSENKFLLFPNPAKNYFHIKSFDNVLHCIEITNALGQTIIQSNFENLFTVNTEQFSKGIYFVKFDNQTKKIIINN